MRTKVVGMVVGLLLIAAFPLSRALTKPAASSVAAEKVGPSPLAARCDQAGAKVAIAAMTNSYQLAISEQDGWVIVRFGSPYGELTPERIDVAITKIANLDSCISEAARSIEFQAPSGKVIARADRVRGIRVF